MDGAKLTIEVVGEDTVLDTPPPPGARPETPHAQPFPPAPPPPPPVPTAGTPSVSLDEQIAAILNSRLNLGPGTGPLDLGAYLKKASPEVIGGMYEQIAPAPPPPPRAESPPFPPPAPGKQPEPDDSFYPRYRELQNRLDMGGTLKEAEIEELRRLTEALNAFKDALDKGPPVAPPPREPGPTTAGSPPPPPPPPRPDDATYGFADVKDRLEAGARFDVLPPEPVPAEPPRLGGPKLPQGRPVEKRPVAEEISDAEKSREQWSGPGAMKDLQGYLPFGLDKTVGKFGDKFQAMGSAYSAASAEATAGGASGAGAAAAGVGEAAMAAGPAAVVAIAALAGKAYESTLKHLGDRASELANNNNMGLVEDASDAAAFSLRALGPPAMAASAAFTLATPVVKEFTKVTAAFVERGAYLAKFSSELGAAQARSSVRTTLADVREADALSPSITRATDASSKMDVGLRDLLLPIKEGIAEIVASGSEIGAEIVTMLRALAPMIKLVVQVGTAVPNATLKVFGEVIHMFRKALEKWPFNVNFEDDGMKEGELNSMLKDFLAAGDRIVGPFAPGARPFAPGQAGLIFGRN